MNSNTSNGPLLRFPNELLQIICCYLSEKDSIAFCRSCRWLHQALYDGICRQNAKTTGTAMKYAAKNGYLHVVQRMLSYSQKFYQDAFFVAIEHGRKDIAEIFLNSGVDVNAGNTKNQTALTLTAELNYIDMIPVLLSHPNIDPNLRNKRGQTPLHVSVQYGNRRIVERLVAACSVHVCAQDKKGLTPVHLAAIKGNKSIAILLSNKMSTLDIKDRECLSPVHYAIMKGHHELLSMFLEELLRREEKEHFDSLLLYAAKQGREAMALEILRVQDIDANPDPISQVDGSSPYLYAARNGCQNLLLELIHRNVNIHQVNSGGENAISYAVMGAQEVILDQLLSYNVEIEDMEKLLIETARKSRFTSFMRLFERKKSNFRLANCACLRAAVEGGNDKIIGQILPITDNINYTSLAIHAAEFKKFELLQLAIRRGANLNLADRDGKTALMYAAGNNHQDSMVSLLENDCDPNLADSEGRTALHLAVIFGSTEAVVLLLDCDKTNPNLQDADTWTPLHYAAAEDWSSIIVHLLLHKNIDRHPIDRNHRTPTQYSHDRSVWNLAA